MSNATNRDLLRGLKRQAQGLSVVLAILLTVSFALGEVVANSDAQRAAFAVPALAAHEPWAQEVTEFGRRVTAAFGVRERTANEYSAWILEAAIRQNFDPHLLAGLIATESSFRSHVVSHVGAVGPAQVRPEYWSRFCGTADLTEPEQNVYCGAQVLAYYRDRCGDEVCALKAYNIGLHSTRRAAAQRYLAKIDKYRSALSGIAAL